MVGRVSWIVKVWKNMWQGDLCWLQSDEFMDRQLSNSCKGNRWLGGVG